MQFHSQSFSSKPALAMVKAPAMHLLTHRFDLRGEKENQKGIKARSSTATPASHSVMAFWLACFAWTDTQQLGGVQKASSVRLCKEQGVRSGDLQITWTSGSGLPPNFETLLHHGSCACHCHSKGDKGAVWSPTPEVEISFKVMFSILPQTGIVGCVIVTILRILKPKSSSIIIYILFPGYSQYTQRQCGQRQHEFLYLGLPVPLPGTGQSCWLRQIVQRCKTWVCDTKHHHLPQTAAHGPLQALCQVHKCPRNCWCYHIPAIFYGIWQE